MDQDDLWFKLKAENDWSLPKPAAWPLRLPIIRNVRCAFHTYRAERWAEAWGSVGIGIGGMSAYDRWVLYAIYRGWA